MGLDAKRQYKLNTNQCFLNKHVRLVSGAKKRGTEEGKLEWGEKISRGKLRILEIFAIQSHRNGIKAGDFSFFPLTGFHSFSPPTSFAGK